MTIPTDTDETAKLVALRAEETGDALAVVADLRAQLAAVQGKADAFEQVGKNQCAALVASDAALTEARAERDRWKADFDAKAKAYAAVYEEMTALKQGRA